jgi:hypothetical protein
MNFQGGLPVLPRHPIVIALVLVLCIGLCLPTAAQLPPDELILVPDFGTLNIMAFDAFNGDVYDLAFLSGSSHFFVPFDVAAGPVGTVLVSGGATNAVHWFDVLTGDYLGIAAPFGGVDTDLLQSPNGMYRSAVPDTITLLVTASSGANANSVVEFDGGGTYIGTRVAPGAGWLDKPTDVVKRGAPYNDLLVTAKDTGIVHRYALDGTPMTDFAVLSPRLDRIHWDEDNDEVLVVAYDGADEGINRFSGAGVFLGRLDPGSLTRYHGVCPLGNGNLLVSTLGGVAEIDLAGNLVEMEAPNLGAAARLIPITIPGLVFRDGFESGATDEW